MNEDIVSIKEEDKPLIWINPKVLKMKEEIERLNNIINKTIEEIEKDRRKKYNDLVKKSFYCNKTDKLLDILKGVDKE